MIFQFIEKVWYYAGLQYFINFSRIYEFEIYNGI